VEDEPGGEPLSRAPAVCRCVRRALLLSLWLVAPAAAQLSPQPRVRIVAGADVAFATRYVWRGLLRTDRMSLQPSGWIGIGGERHLFTAGIGSAFEPGDGDPATMTLGGDPGEIEAWVEVAGRQSHIDWALGFVARDGRSAQAVGLLPAGFDTRELRASLSLREGLLRGMFNLTPTALVVWDIGDIGGRYYQLDLEYAATLLPEPRAIPFSSLFIGVTAAWSDGLAAEGEASAPAYYADDGLTHYEARAALSIVPAAGLPLALHVVRRDRFARDAAVRRVSPDPLVRGRGHLGWWELTASLRTDLLRIHD